MLYRRGEIFGSIEKTYPNGDVDVNYSGTLLTLPGNENELLIPDTKKTMDKEISEDRYFEMLGAVPPIYITTLDSESFKGAFALGEANSHINTPNGVKPAYSAFYQKGDLYYEVSGLVYFTEPGVAVRKSVLDATGSIKEISRYSLPQKNKRIVLNNLPGGYEVVVIDTLTGDNIDESRMADQNQAAKKYIDFIGKYGESKVISKGAFTTWLEKNELNVDRLVEYAGEKDVFLTTDKVIFAKGGKAKEKKVSSYPKKGHILDKFAGIEGTEPPPEDRETGVFINTDIFTTGGDYILGGFDSKDLDNIEVQGDSTVLSILKVKMLFRIRIEKAVERFKNEVEENFRTRVGHKSPTDDEVQNEFDGEIRNLLETYLSLSPSEITDTSVEAVVDLIIENQSSQAWLNTIGERIEKFSSAVMFDGTTINKIDQSKVTIDDAEDHTKFASLEQIMEQLHTITEKS